MEIKAKIFLKYAGWSLGIIIYAITFIMVTKSYVFSNPDIEIQAAKEIACSIGQKEIKIEVKIKNKTSYNLDSSQNYFLSYHLLDSKGKTIKYENKRTSLSNILQGRVTNVELIVSVPKTAGEYKLEIDMVKENKFWYKNRGNRTAITTLIVK